MSIAEQSNAQPQSQSQIQSTTLQTYLPFHTKSFWDDFYKMQGFDTVNWYFDITTLDLPEFNVKRIPTDEAIIIFGPGTSSLLDYFNNNDYKNVIGIDFSDVLIDYLTNKYNKEGFSFEKLDVSTLEETLVSTESIGCYDVVIDVGCIDCLGSDPNKAEDKFIDAVSAAKSALTDDGVFYFFSNGTPEDRVNLLFRVSGIKYKFVQIDMNMKDEYKEFNTSDNIYYLYIIQKS